MVKPRLCLLLLSTLALTVQAMGIAGAQSLTPSPLPGPDNQALGLRAGGFIMFPSVETGVEVTDNVLQTEQSRRGDIGYFVAPSLRIESDWVRHSFSVEAASRHLFYFDNTTENTTDVDARARTRVDIRRGTKLETEAGYSLSQEGRGNPDVPGAAAELPNEHVVDGTATLTHAFNRLEASVAGTVERNMFDDVKLVGGGVQNNSDRNYTEYAGTLRLGYNVSPKVQPFVQARYALRRHDDEVDDNGLRRDSDGVELAGGLRFELSPLLTGDLAVGYTKRDFEDVALEDIGGVTFNGTLKWQPTPITTVAFTAGTSVEETGAGTLSGSINRTIAFSITHAMWQNMLLAGSVEYGVEDFSGGDLAEKTLLLAAGLTYQFNRYAALRLGYSYEKFSSNAAGADYVENRFTAGVLLQR